MRGPSETLDSTTAHGARSEVRRRAHVFHWSFIPAAFLVLFGALGSLSALMMLILQFAILPKFPVLLHSPPPVPFTLIQTLGNVLMILAGILWVTTGVFVRRRQWWRSAFGLLLAYGTGAVAGYMAFPSPP
jgi:hypothetical protein